MRNYVAKQHVLLEKDKNIWFGPFLQTHSKQLKGLCIKALKKANVDKNEWFVLASDRDHQRSVCNNVPQLTDQTDIICPSAMIYFPKFSYF